MKNDKLTYIKSKHTTDIRVMFGDWYCGKIIKLYPGCYEFWQIELNGPNSLKSQRDTVGKLKSDIRTLFEAGKLNGRSQPGGDGHTIFTTIHPFIKERKRQ